MHILNFKRDYLPQLAEVLKPRLHVFVKGVLELDTVSLGPQKNNEIKFYFDLMVRLFPLILIH